MADKAQRAQWSGHDYAHTSAHHRAVDDWFLDRLRPEPTDVVVDLGCGSGEFSASLASLVPDGRVIGVEPDPSMLAIARRHTANNLEFVQSPAKRLAEVVPAASVDLVFSRAMLHWLPVGSYSSCFEAVAQILRPGGWFHSESAGAGNVDALTRLVDEIATDHDLSVPPPFPTAGTVFDLVEAAGFDIPADGVRTVAQRRAFSRESCLKLLETQAAVALTRQTSDQQVADSIVRSLTAAVDRLRRADGTYDQTFVRLEILASRPAHS